MTGADQEPRPIIGLRSIDVAPPRAAGDATETVPGRRVVSSTNPVTTHNGRFSGIEPRIYLIRGIATRRSRG